ncbi:MAG: hypothetical protein JWM53_3059 [bacterium]|nr:hypothetical protein [bacterium]
MVRCTRCRFLFEPPTPGLLPDCRQCGGVTMTVLKIEPNESDELPPAQPTYKFFTIKPDAPAR